MALLTSQLERGETSRGAPSEWRRWSRSCASARRSSRAAAARRPSSGTACGGSSPPASGSTGCSTPAALLELNALAAWELYDGVAPSAGIVTGIGVVEARRCVVVANDATVKGGSYFR